MEVDFDVVVNQQQLARQVKNNEHNVEIESKISVSSSSTDAFSDAVDDKREIMCRKFRLSVFFKMALVWATKNKKKFPTSNEGGSASSIFHYLNSCAMYWPHRFDLMKN
jgi:hypothetical protein